MRLRNWLLTGTSLTLMAVAPLTAQAQEAPPADMPQKCIDGGFTSLEECIAAESAAPAEQPAPAPEAVEPPAPAPEAAPEPAPEPEVVPEAPRPRSGA